MKEVVDDVTVRRVVGAMAVFGEALGELSGDTEMPLQHQRLLLALYIHGDIMQTELVKFSGVKGAAISRTLTKLGRKMGLLWSGETEEDRRFKVARLLPKGREVIEAAARRAALFHPS